MATAHALGRLGEGLVARLLEADGWQILDRNFRCRRKEIDIIARRDDVIVFVEVKTRSGVDYGHPFEAVTPAKRREIERVARAWIARHGRRRVAVTCYRFDVVGVLWDGKGPPRVEHLEDAWRI
jgi:putative endonuclease